MGNDCDVYFAFLVGILGHDLSLGAHWTSFSWTESPYWNVKMRENMEGLCLGEMLGVEF